MKDKPSDFVKIFKPFNNYGADEIAMIWLKDNKEYYLHSFQYVIAPDSREHLVCHFKLR